jgi:hypothetical protein
MCVENMAFARKKTMCGIIMGQNTEKNDIKKNKKK